MRLNPFGPVGDYERADPSSPLPKDIPIIRTRQSNEELEIFTLHRIDPASVLKELGYLKLKATTETWQTLSPSGIKTWFQLHVLQPITGRPPNVMRDVLTWKRISRRTHHRLPIKLAKAENRQIFDALCRLLKSTGGGEITFKQFADCALKAYDESIPREQAMRIARFYYTGQ